jgi:hypothetical protein
VMHGQHVGAPRGVGECGAGWGWCHVGRERPSPALAGEGGCRSQTGEGGGAAGSRKTKKTRHCEERKRRGNPSCGARPRAPLSRAGGRGWHAKHDG